MKISKSTKSMIAATMIAVLPLSAFAGEKDKTQPPMGSAASAQFDALDANSDGRISPSEAATDSKIVFSTVDRNGDGFLDSSEFAHRETTKDAYPEKSPQ